MDEDNPRRLAPQLGLPPGRLLFAAAAAAAATAATAATSSSAPATIAAVAPWLNVGQSFQAEEGVVALRR